MILPVTSRYYSALERAPREEVLAVQFNKLKYELEYVYHNNPFYHRRFDAAGVNLDKIRNLRDFSERIPLVHKKDFLADQETNPPYGERLGVPCEKLCQVHLTSGTTGVGQEVYGVTRRDLEFFGMTWMNSFHWIGITKGDFAVSVLPLTNLSAGMTVLQGMIKMGLIPFPAFGTDSVAKLESMVRFRPHYMVLGTAYAVRLMILAKKMGIDPKRDLPNLKGLTIAGEAYPLSLARELEEFWGTRVYEFYGATQGGTILAFTCEHGVIRNGERGAMHVIEPHFYTEVVNPETLQPVKPGEEGEAILTSLSREASPVIRFRTRDKVRYLPYSYCPCGRPYDIWESGNVSRYDDMMKIKATNVWPSMVDDVLFGSGKVEEYVGRVWIDDDGNERVLIRMAFKGSVSLSAAEQEEFRQARAHDLRARTGISMELAVVPRSELPVFEFKSRRWTDDRAKGLARAVP